MNILTAASDEEERLSKTQHVPVQSIKDTIKDTINLLEDLIEDATDDQLGEVLRMAIIQEELKHHLEKLDEQ